MLDTLERSLLFVRIASLLVPACLRTEWRMEWEAELQHAFLRMRERGDSEAQAQSKLRQFARGSLLDAAWHWFRLFERERLLDDLVRCSQSPWFCLAGITAVIIAIGLVSGLLPMTRAVLLPLPYADARRIATVSQGVAPLSSRTGIQTNWVPLWQIQSKLLEGVATYAWREESIVDLAGRSVQILGARVSENFFSLLGARGNDGRVFRRD